MLNSSTTTETTIPVVAEHLSVEKEAVETGRVRVQKRVHTDHETVTIPLQHDEVSVERIPVNQYVDAPPAVRHEGDTMVIPVVEEEIVVTKRLRLVEEVRITRRTTETTTEQSVTLRREEVIIERGPAELDQTARF